MTLLDYALGDRAGTYLLASCLLVTTLAIIAAILDIPLRALEEAGFHRNQFAARVLPGRILCAVGLAAVLITLLGASVQTYLASSPARDEGSAIGLFLTTNLAFFLGVVIWAFTPPMARHWGLCLGAFGLGLAALFSLLAAILQLHFEAFGILASSHERLLFALMTAAILLALGACLSALLALLVYIARGALVLSAVHRRHSGRLGDAEPHLPVPSFRQAFGQPRQRRLPPLTGSHGSGLQSGQATPNDKAE